MHLVVSERHLMLPRRLPQRLGRYAPVTAALLSSAAFAAPANADVANQANALIVTANTSDVALSYPDPHSIELQRPSIGGGGLVTIATGSTGAIDPAGGEGGVNSTHPLAGGAATGCWDTFTPQVLPGDRILVDNGDFTDVVG